MGRQRVRTSRGWHAARTTTTVQRYSDGPALVEMRNDDITLDRGRWDGGEVISLRKAPGGIPVR